MKTPSTDLFQLIKSLTAQEKKYFKQFSKMYSEERDNNYLLLFDVVDEQTEYDEPAVKKKFTGNAFVNNLGVAKIYLNEKILDALSAMYAETDGAVLLKSRINHFELLAKRKLMNGALIAFEKAYSLAIETGSLTLLPHIIRQKNLMLSHHGKKFSPQEFVVNAEKAIEQTKILENYLQYELLSIKCNLIYTDSTFLVDPKKMKELDEIMKHPLLQGKGDVLSYKAWFYLTRIQYRYYFTKQRTEDCYNLLTNALLYLNKNAKETHEWQVANFHFYTDIIELCFSLQYFDEASVHLKKLNEFIQTKQQPAMALQQNYFAFKIRFHSESGLEIEKGIEHWEKNKTWWQTQQYKFEVNTRGIILVAVLQLYFLAGDWKSALKILNELLTSKLAHGYERFVRIYWLMIQFEIENIELLHDQAASVRKWFQKTKIVSKEESEIIKFFQKIDKAVGKKEVEIQMKELQQRLLKQEDKSANGNSILQDWLESKITTQPMNKILQSKIVKRSN